MLVRMFLLLSFMVLGACASSLNLIQRADETKPLDPNKAVIVGFVSEAFLTQPHGLKIMLKYQDPNKDAVDTRISLDTLGRKNEVTGDDILKSNVLGNSFVYEVPAGTYELTHWYYTYYDGLSAKQNKKLEFTVKPGEVAYIGSFHANSLFMCLYGKDDYSNAIAVVKKAHPFLANAVISNRSQTMTFPGWPNVNAEDVLQKGLCNIQ